MYIVDRYVLRLFVKVLLVSFASAAGLFVVIDFVGNLEEFVTYGQSQGGMLGVLIDYYWARVLSLFDHSAGILALMATMFAIAMLHRTNELTAIMAAGVPPTRVVKPLIIAVGAVSLLGVVNRELMLPNYRHKLARNAQNWLGEQGTRLHPRHDNETEIFLNGARAFTIDRRIEKPNFQLPPNLDRFGKQLSAESAFYHPPAKDRPGGYLLEGVRSPEDLADLASASFNGKRIILSPHDTPWLADKQLFVVSNLGFEQLVAGSSWRQYASLWELLASLRNPSHDYRADVRVTIHARFVQPLLDMTLLLLGLPLVLARRQRNVFLVAALGLLLVGGFLGVQMACHALGGSYLISPALAAWCPLIVFAPLAYVSARSMLD